MEEEEGIFSVDGRALHPVTFTEVAMSYERTSTKRYGQYVKAARPKSGLSGLLDLFTGGGNASASSDPWAEAASGTVAQTGTGAGHAALPSSSAPSPGTPSTVARTGSAIGAFLANLGKPAAPTTPVLPGQVPGVPAVYPVSGMSTNTKLMLAGGGALIFVLLLTRD